MLHGYCGIFIPLYTCTSKIKSRCLEKFFSPPDSKMQEKFSVALVCVLLCDHWVAAHTRTQARTHTHTHRQTNEQIQVNLPNADWVSHGWYFLDYWSCCCIWEAFQYFHILDNRHVPYWKKIELNRLSPRFSPKLCSAIHYRHKSWSKAQSGFVVGSETWKLSFPTDWTFKVTKKYLKHNHHRD